MSTRRCDLCNTDITRSNWSKHLKTKKHLLAIDRHTKETNLFDELPFKFKPPDTEDLFYKLPFNGYPEELAAKPKEVNKVRGIKRFKKEKTSKQSWLSTWKYTPEERNPDWTSFFQDTKPDIVALLHYLLNTHSQIKYQLHLHARFHKETDPDDIAEIHRPTLMESLLNRTDINETIENKYLYLSRKIEEMRNLGSGWVFDYVIWIKLECAKYQALTGDSYVELPKFIQAKHAVVNPQNKNDSMCIVWSVLAALHPVSEHAERITHYTKYLCEINYDGIAFPASIDSIAKFEKQNNLSIFVYHLDKEDLQPLYRSKLTNRSEIPKDTRIRLLYYKNHYAWIKDISRLLHDKTHHQHRIHFCDFCCQSFNSEANCIRHEILCQTIKEIQKTVMPDASKAFLQFQNYMNIIPVPYVIYADFESYMRVTNEPAGKVTTRLTEHVPFAWRYLVIRSDGTIVGKQMFVGDEKYNDAPAEFMKFLKIEVEYIQTELKDIKPMHLTTEDWIQYNSAETCHICRIEFGDSKKVRDHDHITGRFRGAAHQRCNRSLRLTPLIPVFFHNLKGYDSHLIMQGCENIDGIKVIANNIEKYMAFKIGPKLIFKDSLQFLPESLDNLASNLDEGDLRYTDLEFNTDSLVGPERFQLMKRKGVFPYSYLDSLAKLKEPNPPPKEAFTNDLTGEMVSQKDYDHFLNVWNTFEISSLGEYVELYLRSDVAILADIYEKFRVQMFASNALDPAHYITSPHFSFDALLRKCQDEKQEALELLTDPDMHLLFEQGIRGGVSVVSKRFSQANPKFSYQDGEKKPYPDHDPSRPASYIMYLDANNLYGWAMSHALPRGKFKWSDENLDNILKHPIDSSIGYSLEVDLEYPKELHDLHSDYPLASENIKVTAQMFSPFQTSLLEKLGEKAPKAAYKLAPNLRKKEKYFVDYRLLQFYVNQGLVVAKVHRIIEYEQYPWMKGYIEKNTELRKESKSEFDKDLFKFLNNSVFGKSMENVRNRKDVKFPETEKQLRKWTANPRFHAQRIFSEDLAALELLKTEVTLDRPIYAGFTILELSKLLMYKFWYECIKPKYGDKAQLLYTDTDSLIMEIETEDVYEDFRSNPDWFDFSDYPPNHPCYSKENKKVIGTMKDELKGKLALEFVGVRAKMYSILTEDKEEKKKAKGVTKHITEKVLKHEQYKECIFEGKKFFNEMVQIRSKSHKIYTQKVNKLSLNPLDTKRWICEDGIHTVAYGHHKSLKQSLV